MDLRKLALSYPAFDGAVTFYLLPYRRLETEISISELNAMEPQLVYVHIKTGERRLKKPADLAELEAKASAITDAAIAKVQQLKLSDDKAEVVLNPAKAKADKLLAQVEWETVNQWTVMHRTFIYCEGATVAIDFSDVLPQELMAFREYWQTRDRVTADRWQTFQAVIGTSVVNAWWDAYSSTRDTVGAAPKALSEDEPKDFLPEDSGEPSTEPIPTS